VGDQLTVSGSAASTPLVSPQDLTGSGFVHAIASVQGVDLHYVVGGAGPPLVLVHGFLGTWWSWRRVLPPLASEYRVVAVDLRGYGDSDKPVTTTDPGAGYDSRTLAEDLRAVAAQAGFASPSVSWATTWVPRPP
jgi:pimeloyl-ACP methyl ester carboxylesterase